jgi:hypothetical protein
MNSNSIPQKIYKPNTPWRGEKPGRMARAFIKAFIDPAIEIDQEWVPYLDAFRGQPIPLTAFVSHELDRPKARGDQ